MLDIVWPIKLDVHVVLTGLKILVLFPGVSILTLFTVHVGEYFFLVVWILDFGNDQSDIGVVVIDLAIEASLISLVHGQVVVTSWCIHHKADEGKGVELMAGLEG